MMHHVSLAVNKMAPTQKLLIFLLSQLLTLCVFLSLILKTCAYVHHFDSNILNGEHRHLVVDEDMYSYSRRKRDIADVDPKCKEQETKLKDVTKDTFMHSHIFANETNTGLAMTWVGRNDGVILVVTTEENFFSKLPSNIYRSDDGGVSFNMINHLVGNCIIKKQNGLQRNKHNPAKVYVVCHTPEKGTLMYIAENGGKTFDSVSVDFIVTGKISFHPNEQCENYLLTMDDIHRTLHVSTDNGKTWRKILPNVGTFSWSGDLSLACEESLVYATSNPDSDVWKTFLTPDSFDLLKSKDLEGNFETIANKITSFGSEGEFLYSTFVHENGQDRIMKFSKDAGKTWNSAQLPIITKDRFYSILDMSEGLVLMHVDNPGDSGHGTIYTSAAQGVVFSESLTKHLYPNYVSVTDFYKVLSMRGVYLASQMKDDDSIHTMITFNKGGDWQSPRRPEGAKCHDESKDCFLQIHNSYSIRRGIPAQGPLSYSGSVGIILVHGHTADALQTTAPDVYVSSDGGYNWRLALQGPHHYQIADNGGLLVAVPMTTNTKVVKFSTDEGHCWHDYQFTTEPFTLTGLLCEPGSKVMSVSIWGYDQHQKWNVIVLDFSKIITRPCSTSDYEKWTEHSEQQKNNPDISGCLLGQRRDFWRLAKDSWCSNGYDFQATRKVTCCKCSIVDYECDYGYHHPNEQSDTCIKIPEFKQPDINICFRGHEEEIITEGYRKIPEDKCVDGFKPKGKMIELSKICSEDSKVLVLDEEVPPASRAGHVFLVLGIVIISMLVLMMSGYFLRRYYILRKHKVVYRYSLLSQSEGKDDEFEQALSSNVQSIYQDSSDEESSIKQPIKNFSRNQHVKSYHDISDDDLLE